MSLFIQEKFMNKTFKKKKLLVALIASMSMPLVASAADADLMNKIESMSRELEALKAQVKANEEKSAQTAEQVKAVAAKSDTGALNDLKSQVTKLEGKSLSKWLTVGGDYRFRYDYLAGESQTFTDVNATFANAQNALQADFFKNPSTVAGSSTYFGAPQAGGMSTAGALSGLMGFAQGMNGVATYDQANAFLANPNNAGMIQGLGTFAATVPAYKPKNNSLLTNRFGLDIGAKATQDVSVNAHLMMYKGFGAQDDAATTNGGSAPFFADRVGVFDGTLGHVPSGSLLNVDRVYATWGNIADRDIWLSVGRRPATNGAPSNLRLNTGPVGKGGVPALLVDSRLRRHDARLCPGHRRLARRIRQNLLRPRLRERLQQVVWQLALRYQHARRCRGSHRHRSVARLAAVEPRHEHLRCADDEQHLLRQHHGQDQPR